MTSEGRGTILLAAIVVAAALAAATPSQPADQGRPPVAYQQAVKSEQAAKSDAPTSQNLGSSSTSRLYVEAACEHGCGYREDNERWLQKLSTDPVATFTAVLALLTAGLIGVGALQNSLAKRQHFLIHRPHLVVRNVRVVGDIGDPIKITFEVINTGGSKAVIIASAFEGHLASFSYSENPPTTVGDPPANFMGPWVLKPNAVWREYPFVGHFKWSEGHFHETGTPEKGFFWGGKILYRDEYGNNRRLGILRRLDTGTRRFIDLAAPDTDYIYDD